MENRAAKIISYIFHPVFLPSYSLLLLFNLKLYFSFGLTLKSQITLLAFVIVTTVIFPLLIIFMLKKHGLISAVEMGTREDRRLPYVLTSIFYFITYNMFQHLQLPGIYSGYMLGATIILITAIIINFWWKISTHLLGIGGIFGMTAGLSVNLAADLLFLLMTAAFIAGLVGSARLKTDAHKPSEVYAGFIIGSVIMFVVLTVLR